MKNKLGLVVILIVLIFVSASIYAYFAPQLKIKTIKLKGVNTFDENLIISFAEKYIGENIIYLKSEKIERKLSDLKYINNADFKRKFPNTALFNITESEVFFRFIKDQKYYYIDKMGYVYSPKELKRKIILPILKGYEIEDETKKINFNSEMEEFIKNLDEYITVKSDAPKEILFKNQNVTLRYDDKYDIILGELENTSEKFRVLENIKEQIEQEEYEVKYVDISIYNKPVLKLKQ
ncbi:MAG: cell division protein FtsQ/DivIB [Halanaerobiales bacterium]|nr:cell division protein FtsQ/DivIB [Halanaerobiales bacterium]